MGTVQGSTDDLPISGEREVVQRPSFDIGNEKRGRYCNAHTAREERLYADDAGVVSRSSDILVKVVADIVAVCNSFGLEFSEAKMATMCLMANGTDKITFDIEVAGQVYKQTAKAVNLGATVCEDVHHAVETNRRVLLAKLLLRWYGLPLYDHSTVPVRLIVQLVNAEYESQSVRTGVCRRAPTLPFSLLSGAAQEKLIFCIGYKRKCGDDCHVLSYADVLA